MFENSNGIQATNQVVPFDQLIKVFLLGGGFVFYLIKEPKKCIHPFDFGFLCKEIDPFF